MELMWIRFEGACKVDSTCIICLFIYVIYIIRSARHIGSNVVETADPQLHPFHRCYEGELSWGFFVSNGKGFNALHRLEHHLRCSHEYRRRSRAFLHRRHEHRALIRFRQITLKQKLKDRIVKQCWREDEKDWTSDKNHARENWKTEL